MTRASLGVQDFNKSVQLAINRIQPFEQVYNAVELLRGFGIAKYGFNIWFAKTNSKYSGN